MPCASFAQFDFGGGATTDKPWEDFKMSKTTRVKLDFHNAMIDSIISYFQKASGIAIVKDPALTGTLTLTTPKAISLNSAFSMLSETLKLKNFSMSKSDDILVIKSSGGGNGRGGNGGGGGTGFNPADLPPFGQPKIKVYPIQYANASQIARVINDVYAGQQNPMQNLMQMFGGGQQGRGGFGQQGGRGGGRGGGGNPFGQGGGAQSGSTVKASSDDFSNSVIVNAKDEDQGGVERLIKSIDKQTAAPQVSKVFQLTFAVATDLVTVIQNTLYAQAPQGRGGTGSTQNQPIGQQFLNAFRTGGVQQGLGTVVAETRTNSLIVTATKENVEIVTSLIKELDKNVTVEPSTFVYQLQNAKADVVAQLVQQAFGTRQGVGNSGAGRLGAGATGTQAQGTNRNNNTNNRGNQGQGGLGLSQGDGAGNGISLNLLDPNAQSGELETNIAVQGFGGFGQGGGGGGGGQGGFRLGGGQQQNGNPSATQARGANGQLVNVRDITGQVTVIADPQTNQVIIVGSPDAVKVLQGILEQLDRIPEQVMIETIIVEATLDATDRLGVEWKFLQQKAFGNKGTTGTLGTDFGQQTTPPQQGGSYTLKGGDLALFMNAIKTDQSFRVLSTPRIFTSNNVQAQINISQSIPYILSSRQDVNGNFTYTYGFQDVGIVLTVTPRITSNGYVTLQVSQTANDLQGYTTFNAPIVNQRQADTTVTVKDLETVILGGIIRSTVTATTNKLPILGDIPILGQLFKSTSKETTKTELLVFLSPHIVHNSADARKIRDEAQQEMSPANQKTIQQRIVTPPATGKGTGQTGGNGQ